MAACVGTNSGFDLTENSEEKLEINCDSQDFITSEGFNHVLSDPSTMRSSIDKDNVAEVCVEPLDKSSTDIDSISNNESKNNSNAQSSRKPCGNPNKKNLRVTFPEGSEVSGYMDPPIPWDAVSSCTTEVLVSSYLKSCEKFAVKPIQRLLSQLQAIANFQERNETLTLRNDHLNYQHCETLEEVLRRVQFRTIDLEGTRLDDEAAVVMFDMLEYYESCTRLNISFNRSFGARGWQACARLIKKASCLEQLDAQGCNIADHLMPFMGRALKVATSLVSLHLENTMMSGKSLITLVMILKTNETLKELHLADNKLNVSDATQIASLIRYNKTIKHLDLRNNQLQDVGLMHMCGGISEQGSSSGNGLETLVLWNNQLSYQSMNSLCKALMDAKSLLDVNLGRNNITNEGIHRLKEGFLKNRSLLRIRLQATKISCEGAVAIAEFLAETTKLLRVDLRDNDIKTGGLMALSLALKVNKSVIRVDLDKEPKKEYGVKDYISQQKSLLVDIFSYVDQNAKLALKLEEEKKVQKVATCDILSPADEMSSSTLSSELNHCSDSEWSLVEVKEEVKEEVSAIASEHQLVSFTNSNNSSRDKLHLDLQAIPSDNLSDLSSESLNPSPNTNKLSFNVPLSPMVVSQGTACLIPVEINGVFSPEGSFASPKAEESFESAKIDRTIGESFDSLDFQSIDLNSARKDSKVLKKCGKMPREKRKKFIVTKTLGHHYHHHTTSPGPKKMPFKRRSSNVMLDAIDKTANAVSTPSSEQTNIIASSGSDIHSDQSETGSALVLQVTDNPDVVSVGSSSTLPESHENVSSNEVICPKEESSETNADEKMMNSSMNGLLRMDSSNVS